MTTPAAAALYLAQHLVECEGRGWVTYNPLSKPDEELPIIYGFNNGGSYQFLSACLIAEDGTQLGGHICSHEGYMEHDLGIIEGSNPERHRAFREHYPEGYRMEFVGYDAYKTHDKLKAAVELCNQRELETSPANSTD